jgi:hypothetical protein
MKTRYEYLVILFLHYYIVWFLTMLPTFRMYNLLPYSGSKYCPGGRINLRNVRKHRPEPQAVITPNTEEFFTATRTLCINQSTELTSITNDRGSLKPVKDKNSYMQHVEVIYISRYVKYGGHVKLVWRSVLHKCQLMLILYFLTYTDFKQDMF